MIEQLKKWARDRGYRVAWSPASLVENMRLQVLKRRSRSQIDKSFFDHELKSILATAPMAEGKSVVLIAVPRRVPNGGDNRRPSAHPR
jgi:hypothetical protein